MTDEEIIAGLARMHKHLSEMYADYGVNIVSAAADRMAALAAERDDMALRWSNCAMRNAILLREIQLLAADGLETGCVEGDDEFTLFTSIHRLSCEGQAASPPGIEGEG